MNLVSSHCLCASACVCAIDRKGAKKLNPILTFHQQVELLSHNQAVDVKNLPFNVLKFQWFTVYRL